MSVDPFADARAFAQLILELITPGAKPPLLVIAHPSKKDGLVAELAKHSQELTKFRLIGTGTTAKTVQDALGLPVFALRSGPEGGDEMASTLLILVLAVLTQRGVKCGVIFHPDPQWNQVHSTAVQAFYRMLQFYGIMHTLNIESTRELFLPWLFS